MIKKESDPAAAIYHYERFLKLSPNSGKEEMVKTRILACKQQLAQTVSLGPVTEKQQRDFELLAEENKHLRDEVERRRASASRLQNPTNQSGAVPPPTRVSQPTVSGQPAVTAASISNSAAPGQ